MRPTPAMLTWFLAMFSWRVGTGQLADPGQGLCGRGTVADAPDGFGVGSSSWVMLMSLALIDGLVPSSPRTSRGKPAPPRDENRCGVGFLKIS